MTPTGQPADEPYVEPDRCGFWSGETLQHRLGKDGIVDQYRPEAVNYASYHLRLGGEAYVTPTSGSSDRTKRRLEPGEGIEIPPGQLAFLLTKETIKVPKNAMAFVSMRTRSTKFRGLINVSGLHVDPGYHGKLIFVVFNAGPASVHFTEDQELFIIFFADLDRSDSKKVRKEGDVFDAITGDLITPVSEEFLTFKGLDRKLDEAKDRLETRLKAVERDNAVIRWAAALIVGFLIAFAVKALSDDHRPLRADPANSLSTAAANPGGTG